MGCALLNKMILQPLGMKDTGNSYENYNPNKTAIGYYHNGSEADCIDLGWDASAGQSYSTTADLPKLVGLIFSTEKSSKEQVMIFHAKHCFMPKIVSIISFHISWSMERLFVSGCFHPFYILTVTGGMALVQRSNCYVVTWTLQLLSTWYVIISHYLGQN